MAIETDITNILASGHAVVRGLGRSTVASGSDLLQTDVMNRIEALCWDGVANINAGANTIEFRAVPVGSVGVNAVLIGNETEVAATGQLSPPGFIFSDFFSGCLFYLFRDAHGSVYGVHAYRSGGTYPDPMPYFTRLNATLLYFFDSGGQFTTLGQGVFGSVICYVSQNKIVIDFFGMRGDGSVVALVDHARINNWRNAPAIVAPVIGGALGRLPDNTVYAPARMGLRKRIAKYLLNYI